MKKWISVLAIACCLSILVSCAHTIPVQTDSDFSVSTSDIPSNSSVSSVSKEPESGDADNNINSDTNSNASGNTNSNAVGEFEPETQTATLYLVLNGTEKQYPFSYTGELTPDKLIDGISELTGWDLSRQEPVSQGKGGMTVCFSKSSALFVGPPDPQKEEFFVFEPGSLTAGILDSIQQTLQKNFIDPSLGDPSNLDIYYCIEDNQPLVLPDIGFSQPLDQPYTGYRVDESFS